MTQGRIFRSWLPLALSWLLMGAEMPAFTAFVGNMADPRIHLAAWGSMVFPLSLMIEGPIIQMLAASTALADCEDSWRKLRRWMFQLAAGLTAIHALLAFTPLFDFVANSLIGVPVQVQEPARMGLMIMLPWTASIAWRRFNQGVLIRTENARFVTIGTAIRLGTLVAVMKGMPHLGDFSGIVVGSTAVALAVLSEALFSEWISRPIVKKKIIGTTPPEKELTLSAFRSFYIPLALTPLITLFIQPIGSASMSRMPEALNSLACWSAVHGLVFLTRASGFAFQEVVVSFAGEPQALSALRKFARRIALGAVGVLALFAFTPLGEVWFGRISGLPQDIVELSITAISLALLMPGYAVAQSLFQGQLVQARVTKPITQSVIIYAILSALGLWVGILLQPTIGLYWAIGTFTCAGITQTLFLRHHAKHIPAVKATAKKS